MVIVLLAGILLLGAYSYFGRRTYINLELESLDTVLRTATEMYQSQPTDRDTYTNAIKFISSTADVRFYCFFYKDTGLIEFSTNILD